MMLLQLEVKADLIRMAGESELDFAVFACFEEFEISFKIFLSSLPCLWSFNLFPELFYFFFLLFSEFT